MPSLDTHTFSPPRLDVSDWFFGILTMVAFFFRRMMERRNSITHIRGPPSNSFLLGHEHDIAHQQEVGDLDFRWMRKYGSTWRIHGYFGDEWLMTCDAKALQHIFQRAGRNYGKKKDNVHLGRLISPGIVSVHGEDHKRHRKVMNPAFNPVHLRSFLPLFHRIGLKLVDKLKQEAGNAAVTTIPMNKWLSRATLDIIGQASFGYDFGTLDDSQNTLTRMYRTLFTDLGFKLSKATLLFRASWMYLPLPVLNLMRFLPFPPFSRLRAVNMEFEKVGRQLVEQNAQAQRDGQEYGNDVLSVLMRANESEDPRTRLDDGEVMAQMHTLTIAGHETTAILLTWLLLELARHPEYQARLREEIKQKREERGGCAFTADDMDGMKCTVNAIKETLRFHNIVQHLYRVALTDDAIPLDDPIVTATGETIAEVPVRAGQVILASFSAYHRLPQVWGEDADVWNPDRFNDIDPSLQTRVGLVSNLMTFSSGHRGCIGWKFAFMEMQALVTELVENFVFSTSADAAGLLRAPVGGLMMPLISGKEKEGPLLPLNVTLLESQA